MRRDIVLLGAWFTLGLVIVILFALFVARNLLRPLDRLANAAEGVDLKQIAPDIRERFELPQINRRNDVIGRISRAMNDLVSVLYIRMERNERFAADVAHEVKNPLASMRSALETLQMTKGQAQREQLLTVLDSDVKRLDRLVSDISNASRLDAELASEPTQIFDLNKVLDRIVEFHRSTVAEKGIELLWDPYDAPIEIDGHEERLAQVFVNLLVNAISFCEKNDAIRLWTRKRGNLVLAIIEDTGPGIPEENLNDIFKRFYSNRDNSNFGQHSGLGLAISKQIVVAHGGKIWAENIQHIDENGDKNILGARFIVGLSGI